MSRSALLGLPRETVTVLVARLGLLGPGNRCAKQAIHPVPLDWTEQQDGAVPQPGAWALYATCKGFAWLRSLEYLVLYCDDAVVYAADITGCRRGPWYCFEYVDRLRLTGFAWYERGVKVGSSTYPAGGRHEHDRIINGARYSNPASCIRNVGLGRRPVWPCHCACVVCERLGAAEMVLKAADPEAFRLAADAFEDGNENGDHLPVTALLACRGRSAQRPLVYFRSDGIDGDGPDRD
jgi:hypothetical protein